MEMEDTSSSKTVGKERCRAEKAHDQSVKQMQERKLQHGQHQRGKRMDRKGPWGMREGGVVQVLFTLIVATDNRLAAGHAAGKGGEAWGE